MPCEGIGTEWNAQGNLRQGVFSASTAQFFIGLCTQAWRFPGKIWGSQTVHAGKVHTQCIISFCVCLYQIGKSNCAAGSPAAAVDYKAPESFIYSEKRHQSENFQIKSAPAAKTR